MTAEREQKLIGRYRVLERKHTGNVRQVKLALCFALFTGTSSLMSFTMPDVVRSDCTYRPVETTSQMSCVDPYMTAKGVVSGGLALISFGVAIAGFRRARKSLKETRRFIQTYSA